MKISQEQFYQALQLHQLWLRGDSKGKRAKLRGACLRGLVMKEANLCRADLREADLTGNNLNEADLKGADLSGAVLNGACLGGADMKEAVLCHTNFCDANLYEVNLERVKAHRACFHRANLAGEACLAGADLTRADFRKADLFRATLNEAVMYRTDFSGADLEEASLRLVTARGVILEDANLKGADLEGSDLREAIMVRTVLSFACLTGCRLWNIDAMGCQLFLTGCRYFFDGPEGERKVIPGNGRLETLPGNLDYLRIYFRNPIRPGDCETLTTFLQKFAENRKSNLVLRTVDYKRRNILLEGENSEFLETAANFLHQEYLRQPGQSGNFPECIKTPTITLFPLMEEESPKSEPGSVREIPGSGIGPIVFLPVVCTFSTDIPLQGISSLSVSGNRISIEAEKEFGEAITLEICLNGEWQVPKLEDILNRNGARSSAPATLLLRRWGNLRVEESYVFKDGLERFLTIEWQGDSEACLGDIVFCSLPLCIGEPQDCYYLIPDRFPLEIQPMDRLKSRSLPAQLGVILHNPRLKLSLIVLAHNESEQASNWVHEHESRQAVIISTVMKVQARLTRDRQESVGSQVFMALEGDLEHTLGVYRHFYESRGIGVVPLLPPAQNGILYAAYPGGIRKAVKEGKRTGTFAEFTEKLPSIRALGFNTLWLLPVYESEIPFIYSLWDHGRLDPALGTEKDCRTMVDTAHDLGMKVLFDLVPHGPMEDALLLRENPGFISKNKSGTPIFRWGCPACDYANPHYQEWLKDIAVHFMRTMGIDGYRVDCADGGPANWSPGLPYRASYAGLGGALSLMATIRKAIRKENPEAILFPEVNGNPLFFKSAEWVLDHPFYLVLLTIREAADLDRWVADLTSWLDTRRKIYPPNGLLVRFLETPDTAPSRLLFGQELTLAFVALISLTRGVPLFFQGQEKGLEKELKELFYIRRKYPVLGWGEESYEGIRCDEPGVLVFTRGSGADVITCLINFHGRRLETRITRADKPTTPVSLAPFGWAALKGEKRIGGSEERSEQEKEGAFTREGERFLCSVGPWDLVWDRSAGGRLLGARWKNSWVISHSDILTDRGIYDEDCSYSQGQEKNPSFRIPREKEEVSIAFSGHLHSFGERLIHLPEEAPISYTTRHRLDDQGVVKVEITIIPHFHAVNLCAVLEHRLRLPAAKAWSVGQGNRFPGMPNRQPLELNRDEMVFPLLLRLQGPFALAVEVLETPGCRGIALEPADDGGAMLTFFFLEPRQEVLRAGVPLTIKYRVQPLE